MIKINQDNLNVNIQEVTHIQNFCSFNEELDFNKIFFYADRAEGNVIWDPHKFKLSNFEHFKDGFNAIEEIKKIFNYQSEKINAYLFVSQTKLGITPTHHDDETVFLIPTIGQVIYTIYSEKNQKNFFLSKGDLLIIPKSVSHSAIPLCPRIVLSIGLFN